MSDNPGPLPSPTSNQQLAAAQGKVGFGKFLSALAITGLSTYIMNQLSLHGVNFEMTDVVPGVKMSSEAVKSMIEAFLTATAVALTPAHLIASIIDTIRWFKRAWKQISDAINNPPPQ